MLHKWTVLVIIWFEAKTKLHGTNDAHDTSDQSAAHARSMSGEFATRLINLKRRDLVYRRLVRRSFSKFLRPATKKIEFHTLKIRHMSYE